MTMNDNEPQFGLVMPFIACESQGGPFDDAAFVSGFRCGSIDAHLADPETTDYEVQAREGDLAQIDLIAMRHGFTTIVDLDDGGEWYRVVFTRASGSIPEDAAKNTETET